MCLCYPVCFILSSCVFALHCNETPISAQLLAFLRVFCMTEGKPKPYVFITCFFFISFLHFDEIGTLIYASHLLFCTFETYYYLTKFRIPLLHLLLQYNLFNHLLLTVKQNSYTLTVPLHDIRTKWIIGLVQQNQDFPEFLLKRISQSHPVNQVVGQIIPACMQLTSKLC